MHFKLGYNPTFIKYFHENKTYHDEYIEQIYSELVEAVKRVVPQEEINIADENHLVGLLILYDSLINIRFEFSAQRTEKLIKLFFISSSIKKQKLRNLIWDACSRAISSPK